MVQGEDKTVPPWQGGDEGGLDEVFQAVELGCGEDLLAVMAWAGVLRRSHACHAVPRCCYPTARLYTWVAPCSSGFAFQLMPLSRE